MENYLKNSRSKSYPFIEIFWRLPRLAASAFTKLRKWYQTSGSSGYVPSVKMDFDKE
jgi:hypothetical protein